MSGYKKLEEGGPAAMGLPEPAPLPPPEMPSTKLTDASRINKYIDAVQSQAEAFNPQAAGCIGACKPAVTAVIRGVQFVWPWYMWAYSWIYYYVSMAPRTVVQMIFGIALCFFGGTYVASIAAIEAFRQFGGQKVYAEIEVISSQVKLIVAANEEDDKVDANKDGIADVDQMDPAALAQHKLFLAMSVVKDPKKLQEAWGALFTAYLAVLATLRLEFARTTAFALGIVEMCKFPIVRTFAPMLTAAIGPKLVHWTETLIETALTFLAVVFAWYLQMIVSAFYSGLRGGRMFAEALIEFLQQKKTEDGVPYIDKLPFPIARVDPNDPTSPFDPNESFLDEAIGYSLAALGFSFQFFNGFSLPFPLNIVLLPLTMIEWFLRIQISMTGTPLV